MYSVPAPCYPITHVIGLLRVLKAFGLNSNLLRSFWSMLQTVWSGLGVDLDSSPVHC